MAGEVHWDLSGKCDLKRNEKWYDHFPECVFENEDTNPCGPLVCEQIMGMRRGQCIW